MYPTHERDLGVSESYRFNLCTSLPKHQKSQLKFFCLRHHPDKASVPHQCMIPTLTYTGRRLMTHQVHWQLRTMFRWEVLAVQPYSDAVIE